MDQAVKNSLRNHRALLCIAKTNSIERNHFSSLVGITAAVTRERAVVMIWDDPCCNRLFLA